LYLAGQVNEIRTAVEVDVVLDCEVPGVLDRELLHARIVMYNAIYLAIVASIEL